MSGIPGWKRSEEASLELRGWPCLLVFCVRVCACVRTRARDSQPGIGDCMGEWSCTTVVLCVFV